MIKILDNAIPLYYQDFIEDYITGVEKTKSNNETNKYFSLEFCGNISTGIPPFRKNEMGFGKTFFTNNKMNEYAAPLMFPLYHILNSKNIIPRYILEARTFFMMPNGEKSFIQNPHKDKHIPHMSLLYYVRGEDGDTVFYNKGLTPQEYNTHNKEAVKNLQENHIKKRVTPKKGRAILFDGNIWHSGSTPEKDIRIVLNYNFQI